jgi:DNA-directed RNA polymerase, sigma subunit (sigma70/sigma32)
MNYDSYYEQYLEELEGIEDISKNEREELLSLFINGNNEVLVKIIESKLKIVLEIVKSYENLGIAIGDLVQEGNMALTIAVMEYNSGDFDTYIDEKINEVLKTMIDEQRCETEKTEEFIAKVNVLQKVTEVLAKELEKEPSVEELADKMKMSVDEINELIGISIKAMTVPTAEQAEDVGIDVNAIRGADVED